MTDPMSFVMLPRNQETAAECRAILGLPDDAWTDVQIEFGTDSAAIARVGIVLRPDQLLGLAALAAGSAS